VSERLSPGMFLVWTISLTLILVNLWAMFFAHLSNGNVWGHKNYLHLDVGIYLLLAALVVWTPAVIITAWKIRPRRWKSAKRPDSGT
jgi:hypothetical protein